MRKQRFSDRLRDRLRKWLIPRSDASTVVVRVELDGLDELEKGLGHLEQRMDRLAEKARLLNEMLAIVAGKRGDL